MTALEHLQTALRVNRSVPVQHCAQYAAGHGKNRQARLSQDNMSNISKKGNFTVDIPLGPNVPWDVRGSTRFLLFRSNRVTSLPFWAPESPSPSSSDESESSVSNSPPPESASSPLLAMPSKNRKHDSRHGRCCSRITRMRRSMNARSLMRGSRSSSTTGTPSG
jgi:hypothetical protein